MNDDWVEIEFCDSEINCPKKVHNVLEGKKICNLDSMPKEWGNYLVSDGEIIEVSECGYTFHNWESRYDRKIKNKDIKYWMSFNKIKLPNGLYPGE